MQATVRGGFDTFALSAKPAKEFGEGKYLRLDDSEAQAFLYLRNPAPRGATIVSATLRVHARGASTGSRTLTARRVSESWKAGRLNWNNKPGVTGTSVTAAVTSLVDGDAIDFDVTEHVQEFVYGTSHFGWRITTSGTTLHKVYGLDAGQNKPTLIVQWSDRPGVPTDLSPAGGVVSVAKPVLSFTYHDDDKDSLTALQVQIDAAADAVSPDFDSGEVAATVSELDLNDTAYAGLAADATTQWRVRVKDAGGLWSEWSDWASFTRTAKGSLTIDNPAADPNDFVLEPTPPILWTFAGTQTAYRVIVIGGGVEVYDSGKLPGAEDSHTMPAKWNGKRVLKGDGPYLLEVRVWDDEDRVHTRGDTVYVAVGRLFTVNEDAGVTAPTVVGVAQDGGSPAVEFTFTRATAPDSFNIVRNGEVIDAEVDPSDIFVSGTTYTYRDREATPGRPLTYAVRAVVNGEQSEKATASPITTDVHGAWLISDDAEIMLLDFRQTGNSFDQANTYLPLGSEAHKRVIAGTGAFVGAIEGNLVAAAGVDIPAAIEALEAMQDAADVPVRLVVGDFAREVLLGDLTTLPSEDSGRGVTNRVVRVTANIWSA